MTNTAPEPLSLPSKKRQVRIRVALDRTVEPAGFANAVSQGLNQRCRQLPFEEMRDARGAG